jgi:hypothetical protein
VRRLVEPLAPRRLRQARTLSSSAASCSVRSGFSRSHIAELVASCSQKSSPSTRSPYSARKRDSSWGSAWRTASANCSATWPEACCRNMRRCSGLSVSYSASRASRSSTARPSGCCRCRLGAALPLLASWRGRLRCLGASRRRAGGSAAASSLAARAAGRPLGTTLGCAAARAAAGQRAIGSGGIGCGRVAAPCEAVCVLWGQAVVGASCCGSKLLWEQSSRQLGDAAIVCVRDAARGSVLDWSAQCHECDYKGSAQGLWRGMSGTGAHRRNSQ